MTTDPALLRVFNRARLTDRQTNELIGVAHGIIADGVVSQQEAEYLRKWLAANTAVTDNPVVANLLVRVNEMLIDGVLDSEESKELMETLMTFAGGDFELGEVLKSSTLPLDNPQPPLAFDDKRFCFTGTFAYGSRAKCEDVVSTLGGEAGSLTKTTDFLVVGIYATDSWAHSPYGRKIERAVEMKDRGVPIAIVGEQHWTSFLK